MTVVLAIAIEPKDMLVINKLMIPRWLLQIFNSSFLLITVPASCFSNPCHNGGTCIELESGFNCQCTADYEGNICDGKHRAYCNTRFFQYTA